LQGLWHEGLQVGDAGSQRLACMWVVSGWLRAADLRRDVVEGLGGEPEVGQRERHGLVRAESAGHDAVRHLLAREAAAGAVESGAEEIGAKACRLPLEGGGARRRLISGLEVQSAGGEVAGGPP
jgi:hypothetical protein